MKKIVLFMGLTMLSAALYAQTQAITGQVTDLTNGEALPGVNILVKGSTVGTVTDVEGNYRLSVPEEAETLVFSSVGYLSEEITIDNQTTIDLALSPDIQSLSEIVVVGYGTQDKKELTGAIASVNSEAIKDLPVTGLDQALAAQVPGVQVNQSNAAPGGAVNIRVRGTVSINSGSEPLYVIDGYPISVSANQVSNPLSSINPNDIESIDILKDASASAIYGSRASNGVIIITTKKGKSGKPQFSLDAYTGFQRVEKRIDVLNAREFATLYGESRNNSYLDFFGDQGAQITDDNETRQALGATSSDLYHIDPQLADPSQFGEGTDWQDEIFRTAPINNVQLSARGGTDALTYYLSGGYFNQQGVVIESGFERYSFNTSLEANVTNKVRLGFNLNSAYSVNQLVNGEGSWHEGGVVTSALMMPPTMDVRDEDGNFQDLRDVYPSWGFVDVVNPVQIAQENQRAINRFRAFGSLFAEYDIVEGLTFKALLGGDYATSEEDKFTPRTLNDRVRGGNTAYQDNTTARNYLSEFTLNYDKSLGDHHLSALLGYTTQKERRRCTRIEATDFPNDYVQDITGGVISNVISNPREWSLLSYLGRINYDYRGKYLLTATIRRDGSSRFGADNRWGNFPSVSVGWRISEEAFMDNVSFLDDLKVRASYGLTGNNSIGDYASIGLLAPSNYVVDGNVVLGQIKGSLPNENLGWETTAQFNVGLEVGLVQGRLFFQGDYYDKYTRDLLFQVPVSVISGVREYTTNIGEVSNRGWEVSLTTRNVVGDFNWTTSLNVSANRNKVEKLGASDDPIFTGNIAGRSHTATIGYPIGSYYGLQWDGLYLTQEELDNQPENVSVGGRPAFIGDVRWKDIDGNGQIDDEDQSIIGDWQPDFIYGVTNTFSYKNLDLSVLIQGSEGNELYNVQKRNLGIMVLYGNEYAESLNRYQSPANPGNGALPKEKRAVASNSTTSSSDYYVDDASFMRIRNITLGYRLPPGITDNIGFSSLRAYISVQNAFLFTDYLNYNPEVSATNTTTAYQTNIDPLTPGIDYGSYPTARTFTLGINVTF